MPNYVMDQKPNSLAFLRGSRTLRRIQHDIKNADIDIETEEGAIWEIPILSIFFIFFLEFLIKWTWF